MGKILKTTDGSIPLRCDAENGGQDRRAYLLVPTQHLNEAKLELQKYLQALTYHSRTHTQTPPGNGDETTSRTPTRPTEIYIPTPAVLNNLKFLNTLSSEEIWKCAPATIRTPQSTTKTTHKTAAIGTPHGSINRYSNTDIPHTQTHHMAALPQDPAKPPPISLTPQQQPHPHQQPTVNLSDFPPLHGASQQDDTTMGTTASNYSRTILTNNQHHYNARFQEIDDQIKQHQQEFNAIHTRFDSINDQLLRNMTIASEHSKQFTSLEKQVNEMNDALRILLQRSEVSFGGTVTRYSQLAPPDATQIIPQNLHAGNQEHSGKTDHSSMSGASFTSKSRSSSESIKITSPEKKRIRKTNIDQTNIPSVDQEKRAQYETSTPDDNDL